jgi:hypothetical protein
MGRKDIINMISPLLGPAINNMLDKPDNLAAAEKDRDDYKKQLAAMQAAQTPQAPQAPAQVYAPRMKAGGKVKKMASGGKVSSASKRADGCCVKGKTKGRMV